MTPPAPNNQCFGSDWILNGSKCLLFRPNDFRTYLDATLECQLHHASLVSIHSIYQNQFLLQTIKAKYSVQIEAIWVGLHKSSTSGFSWSDKSPTNFLNWDQNEPSSHDQWGNNENCAEIRTWNGKWNDQDCTQKRGYICQRNPVVDPQTLPPRSNFSFPSPSGPILPPSPPIMSTTHRPSSTQRPSSTHRPVGTTPTLPPIQTPKQYTGPSQAGASKGSGGSTPLSGGGIAGILIAAIIVTIAVIGMLVIFKRRQNGGGAALGFENTTYSYNSEQDNGKLHLNSHETES